MKLFCCLKLNLIVDEVDDCVLQHLRRLGQTLHGRRLGGVQLGGGDLDSLLQSLREHGSTNPLGSGLVELLIHFCNEKLIIIKAFFRLQFDCNLSAIW